LIEVIMPRLSQTMEEGTIVYWLKEEGETVEAGEPLLEVESDKASVEVEAPADGVLGKALYQEGEAVPVAMVIAYLLEPGELPPEEWPVPDKDEGTSEGAAEGEHDLRDPVQPLAAPATAAEGPAKVSPRARRLAQSKGVDLLDVKGTGPRGRIVEKDIERFLEQRGSIASDLVVPGTVQKIAAQRLTQSFTSTPHFYLNVEADASGLVRTRRELLDVLQETTGVRLTFSDLFVALVAEALKSHPLANASWENGKIRMRGTVAIGLATATEQGLVVPVIKEAEKKSLEQIVRERKALVDKATAGGLAPDELQGSTFTISNLGMLGVDEFSAIINPPESAILAIGRIAERPVAQDGQVVCRHTVRLTLSVDHRVLDGAAGARFLADLKQLIEDPNVASPHRA
jgi:pyruvate dehydrogenase E2 component (dihydrolipoamide acetyltransferase)